MKTIYLGLDQLIQKQDQDRVPDVHDQVVQNQNLIHQQDLEKAQDQGLVQLDQDQDLCRTHDLDQCPELHPDQNQGLVKVSLAIRWLYWYCCQNGM